MKSNLTLFLIIFLMFKTVTAQEWKWILPYPQSNHLYTVTFADQNTVYAAGEYNTILKSTDQGVRWEVIRNGGNQTFNSLFFMTPETGFAAGNPGIILKTVNGGETWDPVYLNESAGIKQVTMASGTTGYAAGAGLVLKSTDGGNTWNEIYSGPHLWNSVFFLDENTGYVAGDGGKIMKTSDGGATWNDLQAGTTKNINSVVFVNSQTGYAAGDQGLLMRTGNGGDSWTLLFIDTQTDLSSLRFGDETTGYGIGKEGMVIMTDDGYNWRTWQLYTYKDVHAIDCAPGLKYVSVVVGNGGNILRTIYQWTVFDRINDWDATGKNSAVAFANDHTGFVVGDYFLRSDDGGASWYGIGDGSWYSYGYDILFIDSLTGFRVKDGGKYAKTTNGGNSWQEFQIPWCSSEISDVENSSPSTLYMAAFDLYRTADLGLTWTKVISAISSSIPQYVLGTSFPDEKTGYAFGVGIRKTTDYGNTWSYPPSYQYQTFYDGFFTDSLTGVFCGYNGKILYTADGGTTFAEPDSHVDVVLRSITYDEGVWYIAGESGVVLTSPNGIDWALEPRVLSEHLTRIYFTKNHKGFITGETATLLSNGVSATGIPGKKPENQLKIYPNPAKDHILIDIKKATGTAQLEILDVSGKVVRKIQISAGNEVYADLSGLSEGLYLVRMISDGKVRTGKFVRIH